jgi:hypothetical protein
MKLKCTDCHGDASLQKLPHPDKLRAGRLRELPRKAVKEYSTTVHGIARKGGNSRRRGVRGLPRLARHQACKGPWIAHQPREPRGYVRQVRTAATRWCSGPSCRAATIVSQFHDSIHGKALTGAAAASAPTCTNCHGAHIDSAPSPIPTVQTNRARIPDTCGSCHKPERAQFATSQHGKLRLEGNLARAGLQRLP